VIRVGAVEPDITAISQALPPLGQLGAAISVIGPRHRFGDAECDAHARALAEAVAVLTRQLGATTGAVAS
jgi:DNA-binding IclR family transcriptional regulator